MYYSKLIGKSVNTFIPLKDETIKSSLVERGRSLTHSLHFLVRMKPTSTNVFLQLTKKRKTQGERSELYGGCKSISQSNLWRLYLTRLAVWGRALSCKRIIPSDSIPGRFDFMARRSTQPPRNEPHLSALLCLPPFPMLDEHTLYYAHLQSNKETTMWTCAFSLCMSPILQLAVSICNKSVASFCEECVLWQC